MAAPAAHWTEQAPCWQIGVWLAPAAQTVQLGPHAVGSDAAAQRLPHRLYPDWQRSEQALPAQDAVPCGSAQATQAPWHSR
jgi:hypothetical protein